MKRISRRDFLRGTTAGVLGAAVAGVFGSGVQVLADEVEDISLKLWVSEEDLEATEQMCANFAEEHPEYNCTFEVVSMGVDETIDQIKTDPELAADIFNMPSSGIAELEEVGLLYPITVDLDTVNELYSEGAITACSKDDLLYGIPYTPNAWFIYYNKSLFTEEEMQSLDTIMSKDLGDDIYNFSCTIANSWYIEAFFYAAGCTLFGEDGTDPTECSWNSEAGVGVVEYLIDLANNSKYVEDQDGIASSLFNEGKLGALCSGTWSYSGYLETLGDDLGACALPTVTINGEEGRLSNFADYKCFSVKSNTAHPLAAQQLAEYLANEESELLRYEASATSPTCMSLVDSDVIADDVATIALLEQTEYATPQPSISQISEYWTPATSLGEGIINGGVTKENAQEMLDTVVESITTKLTD